MKKIGKIAALGMALSLAGAMVGCGEASNLGVTPDQLNTHIESADLAVTEIINSLNDVHDMDETYTETTESAELIYVGNCGAYSMMALVNSESKEMQQIFIQWRLVEAADTMGLSGSDAMEKWDEAACEDVLSFLLDISQDEAEDLINEEGTYEYDGATYHIFMNKNDGDVCMTVTTHEDLDSMLEYMSEIKVD